MPRVPVASHRRRTKSGVTTVKDHTRRLDLPNEKERESPYKFNVHVRVIVPSTIEKSRRITDSEFRSRIAETKNLMIRLFGGHTTIQAQGGYHSDDLRQDIEEEVAVVEVFTQRKDYLARDKVLRDWLKRKRIEWGQESMAFSIEMPGLPLRSFLIDGDSD